MALVSSGVLIGTTNGGTGAAGPITAGTPSLLRAINERSVLELIHNRGPLSRAQVARVSGLSKPTVSLALCGLLRAELVLEVGRSRGDRGPSAVLYEVNPSAGWVVGIDVGRKWVRAAIADISGKIVARRDERARVTSQRQLIGQIGSIAHRLAREAGVAWSQVTQAAVGSPGVFDPARGPRRGRRDRLPAGGPTRPEGPRQPAPRQLRRSRRRGRHRTRGQAVGNARLAHGRIRVRRRAPREPNGGARGRARGRTAGTRYRHHRPGAGSGAGHPRRGNRSQRRPLDRAHRTRAAPDPSFPAEDRRVGAG